MAWKSKHPAGSVRQDHVAGEVKFLVCVGHDPHSRVAVHFACLRALNSGGRVALLHVLPPPEFQHWIAVGEIMREETREDAEALLRTMAGEVQERLGFMPEINVREGAIGEEILDQVDEDGNIDILVVGAVPGSEGHGKLVSWLAGQLAGKLNIPLVIVPSNLTDEQLRNLT
jgi:nucleotide-binding universal stress UspA family protein